MQKNQEVIRELQLNLKTYNGIKKELVALKNRLKSVSPETVIKLKDEVQWMESQKGRLGRKIEKNLENWEIWTHWMKDISGIGPYIGGNLIMLYYYKFTPICQKCGGDMEDFVCVDCGEKAKGDGLLKHRIEIRDFRQVSSWWKYLGEDNDPVTGRMRRKINLANFKKNYPELKGDELKQAHRDHHKWNHVGRNISWQIGESFNKFNGDHAYKAFYLKKKEAGKRHGDAIRRTRKLFLSHFWHVARELEGLSTEGPYVETVLKHTGIIAPYYWDSVKTQKAA